MRSKWSWAAAMAILLAAPGCYLGAGGVEVGIPPPVPVYPYPVYGPGYYYPPSAYVGVGFVGPIGRGHHHHYGGGHYGGGHGGHHR